ncbi:Sporulation related domain-containing protein [Fontimonas thermophila]|uniref:Sporulation related domain-containing protein n=1 Tax=Fontimonas thermophila TaxID=1076937 RepID=A0A1I2HRJ8_9GAMM|nr:SPOR domain-containing protein [Fontimonas thermophila]SFF31457.1 Sporulation related domain-containing protein [Fontimonas thermophila]
MDEIIKRRLVGAGLLLAAAFLLVSVLPEPHLDKALEEGVPVLTIDLRNPDAPAAGPIEPAASTAIAQASEATAPMSAGEPSPPSEAASPPPQTPAAPTAQNQQPAPETKQPEQRPAPQPADLPAREPTRASPAAASTAGREGRWWVQIGSFADIANARQVEARLRTLGQPVIVAPVETDKGTLYRVRGGPYADEAEAQSAHEQLMRSGYTQARIVGP